MISKITDSSVTYNGDNVALEFAISFPSFESESLDNFLNLLIDGTVVPMVEDTDYTLSDLGVNGVNGKLTLINSGQAWINGGGGGLDVQYSLTIAFETEAFQPASFRSWTNSSPATVEKTLDRLTMHIKAVGDAVETIEDYKDDIDDNTDRIIDLEADVAQLQIDLDLAELEILEIQDLFYSRYIQVPQTATQTLENVNDVESPNVILEYIIVRNSQVQYGREILVAQSGNYVMSPIEKVNDVGVSFSVNNIGGGVAQVRATVDGSSIFLAAISYRLYKFTATP